MVIRTNCRYFKGDVPCEPHKSHGVHCKDCRYFDPVNKKILVMKLGAMGDVMRTTPLLRKIRKIYPGSHISWLTHYPEVVRRNVDNVYAFTLKDILVLLSTSFDVLYNLDKDSEVCALANMIKATAKRGYCLEDGRCAPADDAARHKWLTGLFDDVSKRNTKSYPEEIFEICGFRFENERYLLDMGVETYPNNLKKKKFLIGLNTGCGSRWKSRLWPDEYWVRLAGMLTDSERDAIFLGGPDEDAKNRRMAEATGSAYPGHFSIGTFQSIVGQCDLIVTGVTMALHVAIGLNKKIVLLNNVFNRNEFELYGLGVILEPELDCTCYYSPVCENDCLRLITPEIVAKACNDLLVEGDHGKV